MGTIALEAYPVAGTIFGHITIIYENDAGNEFVVLGWPENQFNIFNFGQITTEAGVPIRQSLDNRPKSEREERGRVELDLGGRRAEDVWKTMVQSAALIDAARIPYAPLGDNAHNSNSTVAAVLQDSGIYLIPYRPDVDRISSYPGDRNRLLEEYSRVFTSAHTSESDDILRGGVLNDTFEAAGGDDDIDGRGGNGDVAVYDGASTEYNIVRDADGSISISHQGGDEADGTDTLRNIEIARFADGVDVDLTAAVIDNPFEDADAPGGGLPIIATTFGTTGDDTLTGTDSVDTIALLRGDDQYFAFGGDDRVDGGAGEDLIVSSDGADTVFGGADADRIYGGADNDLLNGGTGNDQIVAGTGDDVVEGDAGSDRLFGQAGDDTIDGGDAADVISGGFGDDLLSGGESDDFIYGGADNDAIFGGNGNDQAVGGSGNDRIDGEAGNDRLFGESGADVISGGAGDDVLVGSDGNDTISGGEDNDFIYGGADDDVMNGDAGGDNIVAGSGNDTADGGDGNDFIFGETGNDLLLGGDGSDALVGSSGADTLSGGNGGDSLFGGANDDVLDGDAGNDYLAAGSGNDTIDGGTGDDLIFTGSGDDIVVATAGTGLDTVLDFAIGQDLVDLRSFRYSSFDDLAITDASNAVFTSTEIDLGNGDALSLQNIAATDLGASDFLL